MKHRVIAVCGPSGSGKTTVAKFLKTWGATYIEDVSANPYLRDLLEGRPDFNAAANQEWFLQRISEFITTADPSKPMVLDQDPAAVLHVYTRLFHQEGRINTAEYRRLTAILHAIENSLDRWQTPRLSILLDARPEVLRARVLNREADPKVPSLQWYAAVRNCFTELRDILPNVVVISTDDLNVHEVIGKVSAFVP